jgi:DNA replication protein DnaC
MLIEQTLDKLNQLKLTGMAQALREQLQNPECPSLAFEDRLGLLVDREWDAKESRGLTRRLQTARLKQPATVEDLDFHTPRGLDKAGLLALAECHFIKSHHNLIITGPTGVGKSYLACAIANKACRLKYSARYFRLGNLLSTIVLARADGRYPAFMRRLERTDLLLLDDWGLYPVEQEGARDLFDVLEDRSQRGAVIIVSQIPVAHWYDLFAAPTIADAILDRLVHNAYRIDMKGESMRKRNSPPDISEPEPLTTEES